MAQLHFYVPDEIEKQIKQKAKAANLPVSKYLAELVKRETQADAWPEGYAENVLGSWQGELERPPQDPPEKRLDFE